MKTKSPSRKPWRRVLRAEGPLRANCIGNQRLQVTWWDLHLECGHVEERPPRYPPRGDRRPLGFAALHHPRRTSEALPPPKRVRCSYCPEE